MSGPLAESLSSVCRQALSAHLRIDAMPGYGCPGFQSILRRRFMRRVFFMRVCWAAATRFMVRITPRSSSPLA